MNENVLIIKSHFLAVKLVLFCIFLSLVPRIERFIHRKRVNSGINFWLGPFEWIRILSIGVKTIFSKKTNVVSGRKRIVLTLFTGLDFLFIFAVSFLLFVKSNFFIKSDLIFLPLVALAASFSFSLVYEVNQGEKSSFQTATYMGLLKMVTLIPMLLLTLANSVASESILAGNNSPAWSILWQPLGAVVFFYLLILIKKNRLIRNVDGKLYGTTVTTSSERGLKFLFVHSSEYCREFFVLLIFVVNFLGAGEFPFEKHNITIVPLSEEIFEILKGVVILCKVGFVYLFISLMSLYQVRQRFNRYLGLLIGKIIPLSIANYLMTVILFR